MKGATPEVGERGAPLPRFTDDGGFTLLGLLVVVAVINIALGVAVTGWTIIDRRAKEAELIWRGQQYVRALQCHRQQTGGYPDQLEDLLESHCIRALYPDPMAADGQWRLVREADQQRSGAGGGAGGFPALGTGAPVSVEARAFANTTSVTSAQVEAVRIVQNTERLRTTMSALEASRAASAGGTTSGGAAGGGRAGGQGLAAALQSGLQQQLGQQALSAALQSSLQERLSQFQQRLGEFQSLNSRAGSGNGIVGVASTSTREALRTYQGEFTYDAWQFVAR